MQYFFSERQYQIIRMLRYVNIETIAPVVSKGVVYLTFNMAITNSDTRFLFYAKKSGCDFTNTLMLGRLRLVATHDYIKHCIAQYGNNAKKFEEVVFKDDYSEPLFEILGAEKVDSMDYSNYENATVIHDMNLPFPAELKDKFSAIVDGGTLEHIFNFPAAIKSCMTALKTGGHFIGITPANNLMGHGFYQFSPELFYRVFSEVNGFSVKKMFVTSEDNMGAHSKWFEVADPAKVGDRITLVNAKPL
jgi:SAM-dependent methyltransferase